MADDDKVLVGCRMPGGVSLHVMKRLDRPPTGLESSVPVEDMGFIDLPGFTPPKQESFTPVDRRVWDAWWVDNKDGSLVTSGMVFPPDEKAEEKPPEPEKVEKPAPVVPAVAPKPVAPTPSSATPAPAQAASAK